MSIKIATLNLCLGLKSKKDLVARILQEENIDILCLQEIELENMFDENLLQIPGYSLEVEINQNKRRACIYVTRKLNYKRMSDHEGINNHLVIIDIEVNSNETRRIINIYRSFNPQGLSAKDSFQNQLNVCSNSFNYNTVLIGDFNLNENKKHDVNYSHAGLYEMLDEKLSHLNVVQLVNFDTWSRSVGTSHQSSLLDHIYVIRPDLVQNITHKTPCFGDHELVMATLNGRKIHQKTTLQRDWRGYSKELLLDKLRRVNWVNEETTVQEIWNDFEVKLIGIVDEIIPIVEFEGRKVKMKQCPVIRRKLNMRNRLLKVLKKRPSLDLKKRVKNLNVEIRNHFYSIKRSNVRRNIIPGNCKSLWDAVKTAKSGGLDSLPEKMTIGNVVVSGDERCNHFADYFESKVKSITDDTVVDPGVFNGDRKLEADDFMFMTRSDVEKCIKCIKLKNSEGYDRIPQRVIVDGMEQLIDPLSNMFLCVYNESAIPEQWKFSKIVPVHKKGSKSEIENYRPVANLCSVSKVFERLVLNRINQLELAGSCDLTGNGQHGFKKGRGTCSAGLALQSLVARALDDDNYVSMASIDLSAAFDVVDVPLLIKRMKIMGLPNDVVRLVKLWLTERFFYVEIDGCTSITKITWFGIVQGSILGPVLYAIFVSPLFSLEKLICYADDNFGLEWNRNKEVLAANTQAKLARVITWLTMSGLKVNGAKTELCLFYKKDTAPIQLVINGSLIQSKAQINVLGVIFDQKLQWQEQVASCALKSNRALNAIRLIRKFFTTKELLQLVTSNFFTILYYNSEIWHLPTLKQNLKKKIMSLSANALKLCMKYDTRMVSFEKIHEMTQRATPENYLLYRHALMLYKILNSTDYSLEWCELNYNQIFTSRQVCFIASKSNRLKVGQNAFANRSYVLNNKIPLTWFNGSMETFKIKCKQLFLS